MAAIRRPRGPIRLRSLPLLTARVLQLRRVDKGESVGYGATFRAKRPTVLATVALGICRRSHARHRQSGRRRDRAACACRSRAASRWILITLDVTDMPPSSCRVGDEVEFLGDTISLDEVAQAGGTAAYEILTSLAPRVPRHYMEGARMNIFAAIGRAFLTLLAADRPPADVHRRRRGRLRSPADLWPLIVAADDAHRLFLAAGGGPDRVLHRRRAGAADLSRRQPLRRRSHRAADRGAGHHPRAWDR